MIARQTLMRPCRIHGTKPPIPMTSHKGCKKFCYYCWLKSQADRRISQIRPEESLLAQIFGDNRHLQTISEPQLERIKREHRQKNLRRWIALQSAKQG